MKKIRRFSVNENAFVLSPEEMRHICGGDSGLKCRSGACEAYVGDDGPFGGQCVKYTDAICACYAGGHYYYGAPRQNYCDPNGPNS